MTYTPKSSTPIAPAGGNVTILAEAKSASTRKRSRSPADSVVIAGVHYMVFPLETILMKHRQNWCMSGRLAAVRKLGARPIVTETSIAAALTLANLETIARLFGSAGHPDLERVIYRISEKQWLFRNYWSREKANRVAAVAILAYSMEYAKP